MTCRTRDEDIASQAAWLRQKTPDLTRLYAVRAGSEATLSQGVRALNLRRSRYFGLANTNP